MRTKRRSTLIVVDCDDLDKWWNSSATIPQMCRHFGLSRAKYDTMRVDMGMPKRATFKPWHQPWGGRQKGGVVTKYRPDPEVSEEEVQHRIAKVQARWTDEMFTLRAMGRVRPLPYEFPRVSIHWDSR